MKSMLKKVLLIALILLIAGFSVFVLLRGKKEKKENGKKDSKQSYMMMKGDFGSLAKDEKEVLSIVSKNEKKLNIKSAKKELKFEKKEEIESISYFKFQQEYEAIPVYGRYLTVLVRKNGMVAAITGNYQSVGNLKVDYQSSENEMIEAAKKYLGTDVKGCKVGTPQKIIYNFTGKKAVCSWEIPIYGKKTGTLILSDQENKKIDWREEEILNSTSDVSKKYAPGKIMPPVPNDGKTSVTYEAEGMNDKIWTLNVRKKGETYFMENTVNGIWLCKTTDKEKIRENLESLSWKETKKPNKKDVEFAASMQEIDNFWRHNMHRDGIYNDKTTLYLMRGIKGEGTIGYMTRLDNGSPLICLTKTITDLDTKEDDIATLAHEYAHGIQMEDVPFNKTNLQTRSLKEAVSDVLGICAAGEIGKLTKNWNVGNRTLADPSKNYIKFGKKYPYRENMSEYSETIETIGSQEKAREHCVYLNSTILSRTAYLMYHGIETDRYPKEKTEIVNYTKIAKLWYMTLKMLSSEPTFEEFRDKFEFVAKLMEENGDLTHAQISGIRQSFEEVGIRHYDAPEQQFTYVVHEGTQVVIYDKNLHEYDDYTVLDKDDQPVLEKNWHKERGKAILNFENEGTYRIKLCDDHSNQKQQIILKVDSSGREKVKIYTCFGYTQEELVGGNFGNSVVQKDGWIYSFSHDVKYKNASEPYRRKLDEVIKKNGLYKMSVNGGKVERISEKTGKDLQVVGDKVYFIETDESGEGLNLYQMQTNGENEKVLMRNFDGSYVVYDKTIYYIKNRSNEQREMEADKNNLQFSLMKYDTETGKSQIINDMVPGEIKGMTPPYAQVWISDGKLYERYHEDFIYNCIYEMDFHGSHMKKIYEDNGEAYEIQVKGDWAYYNSKYDPVIARKKLSTNTTEKLLNDREAEGSIPFQIQGENLFYSKENAIYRMSVEKGSRSSERVIKNGDMAYYDEYFNKNYNSMKVWGSTDQWIFCTIEVKSQPESRMYDYCINLSDGSSYHLDGRKGIEYFIIK